MKKKFYYLLTDFKERHGPLCHIKFFDDGSGSVYTFHNNFYARFGNESELTKILQS